MNRCGIVTLITDFGLEDPYVGQLKGALYSSYDHIRIVDISHQVTRHDICAAAYTLASSYRFFPKGTVHLAVVDPGVGTSRRIIGAQGRGHFFIAPDNGIISVLLGDGEIDEVRVLSEPRGIRSNTFHGRDIMAPAAAKLAGNRDFTEIGPNIPSEQCVRKECGKCEAVDNGLIGEVLRIDHFGNIRTSIRARDLEQHRIDGPSLMVVLSETTINGISDTYGVHHPGELCAVIDSDGFIEVAVNQGSAAERLQAKKGMPVRIIIA